MVPSSGIYNITMKIDAISNTSPLNAIGITCNKHKTNNAQSFDFWAYSHDYIAWSSSDGTRGMTERSPNGFICGSGKQYEDKNIFILSKFEYKSNNQYYKERLPAIKSGDTIILQYDSNNNILSFFKSNDDKLNASITNLPKNKTFYWIVGHWWKAMSITIVQ